MGSGCTCLEVARAENHGDPDSIDEENEDNLLKEKLKQAASARRSPNEELQHGAMRGDVKKVKKALFNDADVCAANPRGVTSLMLASASSGKDSVKVLEELVLTKAEIHARDHNGWTSLHHACRNGKIESVKFLLTVSADASQTTSDSKTSLMLAVIESKAELCKDLLKLKHVREQVAERDALYCTSLHFSVKDGSIEITKMLVEHKGKVNAKDIDGKTPLMWAAEYGKLDCVKLLAKKSADIDGKDKSQRTALLYACVNSFEGVALWLMNKGADPNFRDVGGDTPLSMADENGLGEFKRAVKMRRADIDDAEGAI